MKTASTCVVLPFVFVSRRLKEALLSAAVVSASHPSDTLAVLARPRPLPMTSLPPPPPSLHPPYRQAVSHFQSQSSTSRNLHSARFTALFCTSPAFLLVLNSLSTRRLVLSRRSFSPPSVFLPFYRSLGRLNLLFSAPLARHHFLQPRRQTHMRSGPSGTRVRGRRAAR